MQQEPEFPALIQRMTQAAAAGDGAAVAACFAADGLYHDCFYGTFVGSEIINLIHNRFHRDAQNFLWHVHDPVQQGNIGYARYVFSYDSILAGAQGKRAMFEGVSICRLAQGKIQDYREVANAVTGLYMLDFSPERIVKHAARESQELTARPESIDHIAK